MDWANPQPQVVSNLDIAFGGDIQHLMPPADRIPPEFGLHREAPHWANGLFSRLFCQGGSVAHLVAKPGIDRVKAIRHIQAIMGSWTPSHEHKAAACAYLFAAWFETPPVQKGPYDD